MSSLLSDLIHKGQRPIVKGPTVDGRLHIKTNYPVDFTSSSEDDDSDDDNYAEEFVQKELKMYRETNNEDIQNPNEPKLELDDIVQELAGSDIRSEVYRVARIPEVYSKYKFDETLAKRDLTIHNYKEMILNVVNSNSVVIIDGPTGCGKTTQVPQYILDNCREKQKDCNIVVTQPRKIATINVAKRVCQERGWALGSVCGYQVGLQKELGADVILAYMTTGILLQKLIHSKSLNHYTHIIVDEIHERNQDLDFLLLVIRKLLFTKSFQTKVILMSATIDADEFAHYFRSQHKGDDISSPIVHINEPSRFTTSICYLDKILPTNEKYHFDKEKPEICQAVMNAFLFLITAFDKIDESDRESDQLSTGSVLVFLPGLKEIEDVEKLLREKESQMRKWEIVALHSSLPNDEQAKAFKRVEPPLRKIILSTNLAESSITVPDVSYVIDFCLTKNMVVDRVTKFSSLQLEWASHVNCVQRAGRVGRVSNGRVYRLVTKEFYMKYMDKKGQPEILRAPLENVVLQTKLLELNEEPKAVLALAINPPNLSNIENTIWHLKEIGAMLQTCRGRRNISDGDITFLGKVMACLPIDVGFSKLIVLGHMFSVLHETVIIAAGCAIQNIFSTPFHQRLQAYNKKLVWADGSCSDLIALLNLYRVWQTYRRDGSFKNPHDELAWCKSNLVSLKGLKEWQLLVGEINARLKRLSIEECSGPSRVHMRASEIATVLKVVICGAFYPNYFIRSASLGQVDEETAVKIVSDRDPCRSVYFTGMDPGQPGNLYKSEIKKMLDLTDDADVDLDGTCKIYVEFKQYQEPERVTVDGQQYLTTIPGKITMPVYRAVKRRHMKEPFHLKILPKTLAWERYNELTKRSTTTSTNGSASVSSRDYDGADDDAASSVGTNDEVNCFTRVEYDPLPSLETEYITVAISSRIDAGHFFCQNVDQITQELLEEINGILNSRPLHQINVGTFDQSKIFACKYESDNQYYRASIQIRLSKTEAQVLFVDYGNIQKIRLKDLCELPNNEPVLRTPPLAIECYLSEIEPAYSVHRAGLWSDKVNRIFDQKTHNIILYGKIFSVVDREVHLELFKSAPSESTSGNLVSINQWLISQGYARHVSESFHSQRDRKVREHVRASENPHGVAKTLGNAKIKRENVDFENGLKGVEKFLKTIELKGPFSPLEMKVYSTIGNGSNKTADVEGSSVNSVLLDSEPKDPHTRLLVAASVNQAAHSDRLMLRQTTIMPNMPGFPFLMALLFCPEMEPKLSDDGTMVSSLLCGLGVHQNTNRPCFPSHDMLLTLDVEINEDVINAVNELRFAMNSTLDIMKNINDTDGRVEQIEQYQRTVKNKIFDLLQMKMKSIKPFHNKNAEVWKNYPLDMEILRPPMMEKMFVWPLHWFAKIRKLNEKSFHIKENLDTMVSMAKKLMPFDFITCEVCNKDLNSLGNLRNHLISDSHKKNEVSMQLEV